MDTPIVDQSSFLLNGPSGDSQDTSHVTANEDIAGDHFAVKTEAEEEMDTSDDTDEEPPQTTQVTRVKEEDSSSSVLRDLLLAEVSNDTEIITAEDRGQKDNDSAPDSTARMPSDETANQTLDQVVKKARVESTVKVQAFKVDTSGRRLCAKEGCTAVARVGKSGLCLPHLRPNGHSGARGKKLTKKQLKEQEEAEKNSLMVLAMHCTACNRQFLQKHALDQHWMQEHRHISPLPTVVSTVAVTAPAPNGTITALKCTHVGCSQLFLDEVTLERHWDTDHKQTTTQIGVNAGLVPKLTVVGQLNKSPIIGQQIQTYHKNPLVRTIAPQPPVQPPLIISTPTMVVNPNLVTIARPGLTSKNHKTSPISQRVITLSSVGLPSSQTSSSLTSVARIVSTATTGPRPLTVFKVLPMTTAQAMPKASLVPVNLRPTTITPIASTTASATPPTTSPICIRATASTTTFRAITSSTNSTVPTVPTTAKPFTGIKPSLKVSTYFRTSQATQTELEVSSRKKAEMAPEKLKELLAKKKEENHIEKSCLGKGVALNPQLQEILINLKDYFEQKNPLWSDFKVCKEIAGATKLGHTSITLAVNHFRKHRTFKVPKKRCRKPTFECSAADREILLRVIYKLKAENRLTSAKGVFTEITGSNEFNPSFKNCSIQTFFKIWNASGFRITETRIINRKPVARGAQVDANRFSRDGTEYVCDWPGCEKRCRLRQHMIYHMRRHTNEKPYECRVAGCEYRCATGSNFIKHLKVHNISSKRELALTGDDDE